MSRNRIFANTTYLSLVVATASPRADLSLITPGTYPVNDGDPSSLSPSSYSSAAFVKIDGACNADDGQLANAGTVTLANVIRANGTSEGSFELTFGLEDKVNGHFHATYCGVDFAQLGDPTCH